MKLIKDINGVVKEVDDTYTLLEGETEVQRNEGDEVKEEAEKTEEEEKEEVVEKTGEAEENLDVPPEEKE